jgi:hypothetical protein
VATLIKLGQMICNTNPPLVIYRQGYSQPNKENILTRHKHRNIKSIVMQTIKSNNYKIQQIYIKSNIISLVNVKTRLI